MMDINACYSCGKPGHIVKYCLNRRIKNKGWRYFNLIFHVKRLQGGNDYSHSSLGVQGKAHLVKSRVCSLN